MKDIKVIGLDLAKSIFYVHGVDSHGKKVLSKKLSRKELLPFFATTKPCLVGMEAGCHANYWAREIEKRGHTAKIMAPQFVKPYIKSNKNDPNDASAICEAVTRPTMRFVHPKTIEQQDIQSVHRIRERIVKRRSSLACEIRGLLGEYGVAIARGIKHLHKTLPVIIADQENQLTSFTRELIQDLFSELLELDAKVAKYDNYIQKILKSSESAQRITTIPGVGPISATAIIAATDPNLFKNGREFAAYLGLVPKQHSSGGKQKLLGISKRGDKYIRTMLIHGARVVICRNEKINRNNPRRVAWVNGLKERRGYCKTAVALANKNARTIWALMMNETTFKLAA